MLPAIKKNSSLERVI